MRKGFSIAIGGMVALMTAATMSGSAATPNAPHSMQEFAQKILSLKNARLTPAALAAVQMTARGDKRLGPNADSSAAAGARKGKGGRYPNGAGLTNVRVNNPAEDSTFIDQTTQSETAIAVSGQNIAVGYNDSQTAPLFLTSGANLTGYSYSHNGGTSWVDGGVLPNAPATVNIGDPWLTSDGAGNMYFSTLAIDVMGNALETRIAKSTDGGQTWSAPVNASPQNLIFESADKDAVTAAGSNVYAAWDDFFVDQNFNFGLGLVFSRSTDGGQTYSASHVDQFLFDSSTGCSFQQYIGALPFIAADGTVYLTAERFSVTDPNCTFTAPFVVDESLFKSSDGGQTWSPRTTISTVNEINALQLGAGQIMRTIEFPSMAQVGKSLYVAWNDSGNGGNSHIRLAKSADQGTTWSTSWVTSGTGDEVQPSATADSAGLHLAYYQRNADNTLDLTVADSNNNANSFTTQRISNVSSPGVVTVPQFDPIIVWGYMGDYIASVSDGSHQYFAWGDNRDVVTNALWPHGRNDPDVFFARR